MNCPDCQGKLVPRTYEGVVLDQCIQCSGILLTELKLKQIEVSQEQTLDKNKQHSQSRGYDSTRHCPSCSQVMEKKQYGKFKGKTIDTCNACKLIWLDEGELEDIQVAYEMYVKNLKKSKSQPKPAAQHIIQFSCPKCGCVQEEKEVCVECGIIFSKFMAAEGQRAVQEGKTAKAGNIFETTLKDIDSFRVNQRHEWGEILSGFEVANRYRIQAGNEYYTAEEKSTGFASLITRTFLSSMRPFEINIWDAENQHVLTLIRPLRAYFHEVRIDDVKHNKLGRVQRRFAIINKRYSVYNAHDKEILSINGPLIRPWTFFINRNGREIGRISKKWSGLMKEMYTDADSFGIKFPKSLDNKTKCLLLGAVFLIDFLHFEQNQN
jgi:Zn-finger nucleic acid-binding protein/uncharacterized protein YxjI